MPMLAGVEIADSFAEAFPMAATRLIVTAASPRWAMIAATAATGYAASVIGCDAEAGIERELGPTETPDGRAGVSLLFFAFSRDALQKAVVNRTAQCLLTCATTAVYSGLVGDPGKAMKLGGQLRYYGDGWQIAKQLGGERFWRIPTMDGEFLVADEIGTTKGVAGGNLIFIGRTQAETLQAAEVAVEAMRRVPGVILPFPGGVVRSGSKVGSKYKALKASTNEAYCPLLKGVVSTKLPPESSAVYEIVIDGLTEATVRAAMSAGLHAACTCPGLLKIDAGNYGGKLGPVHLHLRELIS